MTGSALPAQDVSGRQPTWGGGSEGGKISTPGPFRPVPGADFFTTFRLLPAPLASPQRARATPRVLRGLPQHPQATLQDPSGRPRGAPGHPKDEKRAFIPTRQAPSGSCLGPAGGCPGAPKTALWMLTGPPRCAQGRPRGAPETPRGRPRTPKEPPGNFKGPPMTPSSHSNEPTSTPGTPQGRK